MSDRPERAVYRSLLNSYKHSIKTYGPTPKGVWMDKENGHDKLLRRMDTMLAPSPANVALDLLDIGCGPGLTLDYLEAQGRLDTLAYHGIDLSPTMIRHAQRRWPGWNFELRDLIEQPLACPRAHTIINGVLTYKDRLSFEEMERFACQLLAASWAATEVCLSFNVMSTHVDRTREDLFHWPMDSAMRFCRQALARHVVIMADYGLHEYTIHVFRSERGSATRLPPAWTDGAA